MKTTRAERAYQFSVLAPGLPGIQLFLVEAPSDAAGERRLRHDLQLPHAATVTLQRAANAGDIERVGLGVGGIIRIK